MYMYVCMYVYIYIYIYMSRGFDLDQMGPATGSCELSEGTFGST